MSDIVLATLNARYIHASLGLRYLLANLGELRPRAALREFTINESSTDIAERLLAEQPRIIGLGLYIWNVTQTTEVVALIKTAAPHTIIVLGGPEASHEQESLPAAQWADYIIAGQGEHAFRELCTQLLAGDRPAHNIIQPALPSLDSLLMPYREYSDEDVGCKILSSLDPPQLTVYFPRLILEWEPPCRRSSPRRKLCARPARAPCATAPSAPPSAPR